MTLNDRIRQFGTHIRNEETKLYQNNEKNFFGRKWFTPYPEFKAIEGPEWVKNPLRQNCPKVKKTVNSNLKLIFSTLIFLNQTFPVVELKPELQSCPDSTLTSILS